MTETKEINMPDYDVVLMPRPSDEKATVRRYHPEMPQFAFTAYGVQLDWCGEDGDMIAHGHVAVQRFIAAANRISRVDAGLRNIADDPRATYDDFRSVVQHRWAIRLPKCDCPHRGAACQRPDEHDIDADPEMWQITWNVTADTPGAFPVTLGCFS